MNGVTDAAPHQGSPQDEAARDNGAALGDIFKALKTMGFYPSGHPLRTESLRQAFRSLTTVMRGKDMTLVITRTGFSLADGGAAVDSTPMTLALAKELFLRRTQRLTFLPDLSQDDLNAFLTLLTVDAQQLVALGGLEKELARRCVKTVWANAIDLSDIWQKRQEMEDAETSAPESDKEELPADAGTPEERFDDIAIAELLDLMEGEPDDNRYLRLARQVASKAENLKDEGHFLELLTAMDALILQASAERRSVTQKEFAAFTVEQVAAGPMTDVLLRLLEDRDAEDPERIYRIVIPLGAKIVYPVIHRLCITDDLYARKALATALVRIGTAAVAPLVAMLRDERSHVVRNMVVILGEIGSSESTAALKATLRHSDQRVRKEAIRTLVKIGGSEAENLIIELLADKDESIVRQAILSLGIMKSRAALQPLVEIVTARDLFLATLALKKDAVQALGRIGDRRATPHLLGILEGQRWLAWSRWEDLKIVAASALGQLGDESALPSLKLLADRGSELGRACSEAVDTIERLGGGDL
ncbi:MAG TPA: HEAT repeat domain-containing protein [Geobacteraceae bacterium]